MTVPAAPRGAKAAGRRLWLSVVDLYELDEHEMVLLREAVRVVDLLAELHAVVERDGPMLTAPDGAVRTHPAAVEARQSRIALARLIGVLRLPTGDDGEVAAGARPQRRVGVRGTYGVRAVS